MASEHTVVVDVYYRGSFLFQWRDCFTSVPTLGQLVHKLLSNPDACTKYSTRVQLLNLPDPTTREFSKHLFLGLVPLSLKPSISTWNVDHLPPVVIVPDLLFPFMYAYITTIVTESNVQLSQLPLTGPATPYELLTFFRELLPSSILSLSDRFLLSDVGQLHHTWILLEPPGIH